MHPTRYLLLVVALGVSVSLTTIGRTASGTVGQSRSATLVPLEDLSTTSHVRKLDGPSVTVKVRAMVPENVKVSDPDQGTVRATVMAIDGQTNRVKIHTHEGQLLTLFLASESVAGMRVGDQFILQVAQRSGP